MFGNVIIDCIVGVFIFGFIIWIVYVGYARYIDARAAKEVQEEYHHKLKKAIQ